ncbi:MAG: S9 family peptidase, partial [Xanthomonadaceae bacterium]|nr:S9 family peptidase [Xanthomonadaceae bacterium]
KWLVAQGWTEHSRIGVEGGSNGGLLIAAMELQASDLIGAAIANVGVYDMMRFHKFTRGFHWINEYGSLRSKEEFQAMLKYSPVHNVTPAEYAPILISTGNKDDRVAPIHSFKLAAALQEAQKGTNPILLRVNANSAHGAGTRLEYVKQTAEEFAFFMEFLGMLTKEEKASSGQTPPP